MKTPPRIVAVDDKPHHLKAILEAFQDYGTPCLGLTYDPSVDLDASHFAGVRILLLDLHLLDSIVSTDNKSHFANIASILERNISPLGGPFVLVVWTEHAHLKSDLISYLDRNLDAERPHARPLTVLSIAKEQFINVTSGERKAAADLLGAVSDAVSNNPQLNALLSWETEVIAAAGSTLSALLSLVPHTQRTTGEHSKAVDTILSRLAREAVGPAHVAIDPRSAIAAILGPILADRIVNQAPQEEAAEIWSKAVTRHTDANLGDATLEEAGQVNRMLHVALPPYEAVRPTDWGAVSEMPDDFMKEDAFKALFGTTLRDMLGGEFKVGRADRGRCRLRLVRVGAVCDHAQNRGGPLPFQFGVEMPADVQRKIDKSGQFRPPASEWASPTLVCNKGDVPFVLAVNVRYTVSFTRAVASGWMAAYRLREQLLVHLIAHWTGYVARPGVVRL